MQTRRVRTVRRKSTAEERERHQRLRELIEQEKPEIVARGRAELRRFARLRQVGRELKATREAAGVSLSQMQERTGIDSANLSRLENGLVPNPTVETLARYAEALNRELVLSLQEPLAASRP